MSVEMQVESFESIWDSWEGALPSCATNTVFVTPWWHKTWWDNFGASDANSEQRILSFRDGDDLLGIAPLMATGERLTFLGDKDLTDYFDFIAPTANLERFYPRCGTLSPPMTAGRRSICRPYRPARPRSKDFPRWQKARA